MINDDHTLDRWMPVWTDDGLIAAIPLQGMNTRGIPALERFNELMDNAFDLGFQPFAYPVWHPDGTRMFFEGMVLADPEWDDFEEGAAGQAAFFGAQSPDGWVVSWRNKDVIEFPFQRINDCLIRLYQQELDDAEDRDLPYRKFRIRLHVVRREDHDPRHPVGLLLTTADGDEMTPDIARAVYARVSNSRGVINP